MKFDCNTPENRLFIPEEWKMQEQLPQKLSFSEFG